MALGIYEKAITIFNEVHRIKPDWERPVFNLGRVYLKLGEREKALDYLYRAHELNPENEDTHFYLGVFFLQNEDFTQAKAYYIKSLALEAYLWAEAGLKVDSENKRTKTLYGRIREQIQI
ncbi:MULTISPECIES: tetratricopeptide repeat protein [Paenibacillus]|uniref:tetratricopeptide repeat protein n=1 Tax=Paenibacillus TaxID=44249 RepID=UPI00073F3194|nr:MULTISPECIES: tetratricopeptide repeat protein [Paenibacillus]MDU4697770.1 tetratricopeptide repeat protein [Paenibacillus sp.]